MERLRRKRALQRHALAATVATALIGNPLVPEAAPSYRVEYVVKGTTNTLAEAVTGFSHHSMLTPFASWLHLEGRTAGELRLVDPASKQVVARLDVTRSSRRRGRT